MPQGAELVHSVYSDLIEDKRKWYRVWWDNIRSMDWTDIFPSLAISGGPAAYFILGGAFAMLSFSTAGIALGAVASGVIGWQLFKYPIKRLCANIVGLFTNNKPKWGLRTAGSERSLAVQQAESERLLAEERRQNVILLAAVEKLEKSNKAFVSRLDELETALVRQSDMTTLNQEIYQAKTKQVLEEVAEQHKEDIEQLKLDHTQHMRDLKHEHRKANRAINHELKKTKLAHEKLKSNHLKLSAEREKLREIYPDIGLPEQATRSKSYSPPPSYAGYPSGTHFKPAPVSEIKNDSNDESSTLSDSSASLGPKSNSDTE